MQVRWGTHGDHAMIALSPNSVQEIYDLTIRAFNLAEKYRTPVVLLADETIAHMREEITTPPPETIEIVNRKKPETTEKAFFGSQEIPPMPAVGDGFNVPVTGSTHNEIGRRYTADPIVHRRLVERLVSKIERNAEQLTEYEGYNVDDCEAGIVAYGCTSRAIYETVERAEEKAIKVGFIRLKTIWPFPDRVIREMAHNASVLFVPEMNLKQLFYEVERAVGGAAPVFPINKIGGGEMIRPGELLSEIVRRLRSLD
jgi:2-oxoglutarate ferredoxin oxidoreductase subunit alpha